LRYRGNGRGLAKSEFGSRRISDKWSLFLLGVETWLKQVAQGVKWPGGNGENGRTHSKDEFYEGTLSWIE
jgi:hypothetical protein